MGCAMSIQEFINSLTAEQRVKARSCKNANELIAFASKEKLVLPDDALEDIAGGWSQANGSKQGPKCPECGSTDTRYVYDGEYDCVCRTCGLGFRGGGQQPDWLRRP